MDLLDYGSSDDDDDNEDKAPPTIAPVPKATVTAATTTSILKNRLPPRTNNQQSKKGKKLLSLQAVLPPHILEQLTQSQVRGGAYEDEDEDDDGWAKTKLKQKLPSEKSSSYGGRDSGIDSFLSELHQSAPAITMKPKKEQAPGKLGAAFLSTTTTVVTTQQSGVVRDIHGEPQQTQQQEAQVEIPASVKTSSSSLTFSSVPRPSRKINPAVPVAVNNGGTTTSTAETVSLDSQPAEDSAGAAVVSAAAAAAATTPTGNNSNKKRRRQEMERLLRQGQLDAIDKNQSSAATTIAMHQPQSYVPTDGAAAHVDTTGLVRVAPTPMYDPRQGQAVVGSASTTTAGRGKNQINHLLAHAASLELARARGMVAKPGGRNSHRANAKRKYGF